VISMFTYQKQQHAFGQIAGEPNPMERKFVQSLIERPSRSLKNSFAFRG